MLLGMFVHSSSSPAAPASKATKQMSLDSFSRPSTRLAKKAAQVSQNEGQTEHTTKETPHGAPKKVLSGPPKKGLRISTIKEGRACLEEAQLIEPEDAPDIETLAGALVQIALFLGLSQATRDTVCAVAFLLVQVTLDDAGDEATERIVEQVAAKLTDEVEAAATLAKEQLKAMVREATLCGVQEGLSGALASAEARLRAVTDEAATKLKEVAQGVSEMTTKFTDSTTTVCVTHLQQVKNQGN